MKRSFITCSYSLAFKAAVNMRKLIRCGRRVFYATVAFVGLCFFLLHYYMLLHGQQNLLLFPKTQLKKSVHLKQPSDFHVLDLVQKNFTQAERKQVISTKSKLSEVTFDEADMRDEHGEQYTIVIWKHLSGKPGYLANPRECLGNIECDVTYDTANVDKAHAVVFAADSISSSNLPQTRYPWQLYAWWTLESPLHTSIAQSNLDGYFNLTFHYRLDADVYAPYGSINLILRELAKAKEGSVDELLAEKRQANQMAAWAVSNCYKQRMAYAKSLMDAGLKVDTFGSCFGGRQIGSGKYSNSFYEQLRKYRFYFAFENSVGCKDYFTEKFWFNGLRSGAVPIVWGSRKSDLLKVAPSHSFIHASDFETPQNLVAYLKYLASNETAYAEYLQWRTWIDHPERIESHLRMENRENDLRSFCKLCAIVQDNGRKRKRGLNPKQRIVNSLHEAWQGTEKGLCHK